MARMAVIVLILGICLPEALQAGVVLEAGEIDSSKVRVGVFAEVVYGKGKRDPVSGEWEKLGRVSGYIKAVDAERLTIALGEGALKEQIAFTRIQKLLLAESSRDMDRLKDTLRRRKGPVSILRLSEGRRIRIHTRGMEEGIVARVHRATSDTLFFKKRIREKRPASIALTDISRLEVYQYHKSYAKQGAAIGAFAGIVISYILINREINNENEFGDDPGFGGFYLLFGPPIFGLTGAIGGALVGGVFFSHDVWQTVDLSPSTVEGRHRLSYRLSFRF